MCSFKSIYFVIFVLNLYETNAQISDKRLCVDPDCSEIISLAKTLIRYSSPDRRILSFSPNTDLKIYSKEAGSETRLWGAELNGKRGYVPKQYVREYKIFHKPTVIVDIEPNQKPQVPIDTNGQSLEPNKVKESFEVVDGTTIYINPQDGINPSSTESPVRPTAVPSSSSILSENVEPLKSDEKPVEEEVDNTENTKSVVKNVFSTLANWMNNDLDTEEFEDDDEDNEEEDEDEDEGEDEDETMEEFSDLTQNITQHKVEVEIEEKDNKNLLHISPEIKVSTYNLQLGQPLDKEMSNKEIPSDAVNQNNLPQKVENDGNGKDIPEISEPSVKVNNVKHQLSKDAVGYSQEKNGNREEQKLLKSNVEVREDKSIHINEEESVTQFSIGNDIPMPINDLNEVTPNPISPSETAQRNHDLNVNNLENELASPILVSNNENNVSKTNVEGTQNKIINPKSDIFQLAAENKTLHVEPTQEPQNAEVHEPILDNKTASVLGDLAMAAANLIFKENSKEDKIDKSKKVYDKEGETLVLSDKEKNGEIERPESLDNSGNGSDKDTVEDASEQNSLNGLLQNEDNLGKDATKSESSGKITNSNMKSTPGQYVTKNVSAEQIEEDVKENTSTENTNIVNDLEEVVSENYNEVRNVPEQDIFDTTQMKQEEVENNLSEENISDININGGKIHENRERAVLSDSSFLQSADNEEIEEGKDKLRTVGKVLEGSTANGYCDLNDEICKSGQTVHASEDTGMSFSSDVFLYLSTTAISVIIFLIVYLAFDRNKREAPLVARINKLEKELLITVKENELLQERGSSEIVQEVESYPNDLVTQLTQRLAEMELTKRTLEDQILRLQEELVNKESLEEQIENLEKELETSTEVGMELNRIISEMLDPTNGSERLKENVEQLQRQLLEQKSTISTINDTLHDKETENQKLYIELEINKKKVTNLQNKLDEMVDKILKIEKEKDQQQNTLQNDISIYQKKYNEVILKEEILNNEIQGLRNQLSEVQRQTELKTREYNLLKESLNGVKAIKNDTDALNSLLDATSVKAELQQLKIDNDKYVIQLQQEQTIKISIEKKYQVLAEEVNYLRQKYEQADKEKVEVNSKLEVLGNYFKKREAELQEEIIKYKSIWDAKEGEATSTSERVKYMQEEIENYKSQNESLKQEIISQEVDLKSQISVLEKKIHENWVSARQTERKLEDARQEAAQLRNRLTLRERAITEERTQNRLQSPVEQNGELTLSPHPMESPASPPLLYGVRDHITKSPPLPGLPPFLPPPPGAPFMPPPIHGMPPFIPPPPSMFPGDHRPPPLGRMSSPPLNSRYSPDTSAFSPYDRNSPSPPYDSEYGVSPPPMRGYSPYNSREPRRDYKRPPHIRTNGRNKGSVISSGSDHSNDSLDKINRKQSKLV